MFVAQTNRRLMLGVDQFMRLGLDTMARFGSGSLLEHSQIKFKWLSIPELDHGELCVVRIQQHIPFSSNRRGWGKQGHALSTANPFVSEPPQRFVSSFVPAHRKSFNVKPRNPKCIGDLACDGHKICRPKIRFQVYKGFNRSQRKRG